MLQGIESSLQAQYSGSKPVPDTMCPAPAEHAASCVRKHTCSNGAPVLGFRVNFAGMSTIPTYRLWCAVGGH
jgi:hypothetical protein